MEDMNLHIQEVEWTPSRINLHSYTKTRQSQTVKRQKEDLERNKRAATCQVQGLLSKVNSRFLTRNHEA